jgi:hypothetical protein
MIALNRAHEKELNDLELFYDGKRKALKALIDKKNSEKKK